MIGQAIDRLISRAKRGRILLVLALSLPCGGAAAESEDALKVACRSLLQRSVFNCGCTTEFLEQHFNVEQAEIPLRFWVFAVNDDTERDLRVFYARHGREAIDDTVMRFHACRDRLRIYCANGGAPAMAD